MTISADQTAVFDFLGNPATYNPISPVRRIDTHGASVFLAGGGAYKVKRAVRFPYMDFSTIQKRKTACENEMVVNRDNAPELYLGVVPITRDSTGLHIAGKGEIVEWAVHMRRFDEDMTLDKLAEKRKIDSALIDQLAQVISAAHQRAPQRRGAPAADSIRDVILETLDELEQTHDATAAKIADLRDSMLQTYHANEALLVRRGLNGKVRRCHGDMHLGNIVLHAGKPILFDAIEFNDELATIDILYDLAFLIMDLSKRGFRDHACRLLNRYLWLSEDEAGEIEGLALFPLFLALRATIRAKVLAAQKTQGAEPHSDQIRSYVQAARAFIKPSQPRLIAIGGLSGTGKTKLAETLAHKFGAWPGALHLRSDIERKKAFGVAATSRLPVEAYNSDVSAKVYCRLEALAEAGLKSGHSIILDTTFRDPKERSALQELATRAGVPFSGVWLEAPFAIRMSRVQGRTGDASDATPQVARSQDTENIGLIDWQKVDAGQATEAVCNAVLALLRLQEG